MATYAQQSAPASSGGFALIGSTPTVGAAWADTSNGYGGASAFYKNDGVTYWNSTEWEVVQIPTNAGNADGYVEGVFTAEGDDWIFIVHARCQASGQRYQLTLSGSSGNSWISLESGGGGFPGTVVATTTHGVASSNRTQHTIRLTFTGSSFEGSLDGAAAFISGTNGTLTAAGYAGIGGRSTRFHTMVGVDTTGGAAATTPPPLPRFNLAILNH